MENDSCLCVGTGSLEFFGCKTLPASSRRACTWHMIRIRYVKMKLFYVRSRVMIGFTSAATLLVRKKGSTSSSMPW